MNSSWIRVENMSRSFGSRKIFDSGIIEVQAPRWVALCGANGSGKTTLIRILSTLCLPSSGDAKIFGHSVIEQPEKVRALIGVSLTGEGGFFRKLTGYENLKLFAGLRGVSSAQVNDRVEHWMGILPIREALALPYGLASSGQKQALRLVRAFIHDPKIVLLDEPSRSLDTASVSRFLSECRRLSKTTLIISSTHHEMEKAMTPHLWIIEKQFLSSITKKEVPTHRSSEVWVSTETL